MQVPRFTYRLLALTVALLLPTPLWSAEGQDRPDFLLDSATGSIDGKRALAIYGVIEGADESTRRLLDPAECVAYLVPDGERLEATDGRPCGQWLLAPRDFYAVWVEAPGWMSSAPKRIAYEPEPFSGRGFQVAAAVEAAGYVLVDPATLSADHHLWLMLAKPAVPTAVIADPLVRLVEAGDVADGVQMPAGTVIAGLWNARHGELVALASPIDLVAGATSRPTLSPGSDRGTVFLQLDHEAMDRGGAGGDLDLALETGEDDPVAPDVVTRGQFRSYAVWYDVAPGASRLSGGTAGAGLLPQTVEVRPGELSSIRAEIVERPRLDVELDLPVALDDENLVLTLREEGREAIVRELRLPSGERQLALERLPFARLEVELETSVGTFDETVDLTAGGSAHLLLSPDLIELTGTVRFGDEGHRATIELESVERQATSTETDGDGRYAVATLEPIRFVTVTLDRFAAGPYVEVFVPAITEDRELDFDLSDSRVELAVSDAMTGQPIAAADLALRFQPASGAGMGIMQTLQTDADGRALLPPPREGVVEVRATAAGYRRMDAPLEIPLAEAMADAVYPVQLTPIGEVDELVLSLADGRPAAAATVLAVSSLEVPDLQLMARADAEGRVEIPRSVRGQTLAISHPQASFLFRPWTAGERAVSWSLPAPGPPLHLRVVDGRGDPAPGAEVALWIDGRRIAGRLLFGLSRAPLHTAADGTWSAAGVPPGGVAATAHRLAQPDAATLEALATRVSYPWPQPVELTVVE